MALSTQSRPLLVPAADILAKNMRAQESARIPPAAAASDAGGAPSGTRNALIGLGAATEQSNQHARSQILFHRASATASPSPFTLFLTRLFSKKPAPPPPDPAEKPPTSALASIFAKLVPPLEKAAALVSRLPDPTVLFLALVLVVLLIERARPHWLRPVLAKVAAVATFLPLFALALLWRKTELFATLREGQNPLSHPAEHRLDAVEAELAERESRVKTAQEQLRKNRAQLDALRKELAKDPHARDPNAVIVPSRKAAEMIAAGALGAGYDADAAHAVEQRRKEESVRRSREAWRARAEETEDNVDEAQERLKLMADHAATAYRKRTRELKTASGAGGGPLRSGDRLISLRKVIAVGGKKEDTGVAEGDPEAPVVVGSRSLRLSRQSERSFNSSAAHSTASHSRRRLGLFRKKKRVPAVQTDEAGLQPEPAPHPSRLEDRPIMVQSQPAPNPSRLEDRPIMV